MNTIFRSSLLLLLVFVVLACAAACKSNNAVGPETTATPPVDLRKSRVRTGLIGYIVKDNKDSDSCVAMHSFLRTSETKSENAKLYRIASDETSMEAAQRAISDGCDGVVISSGEADISATVSALTDAGLYVVTLFESGGDVSVTIDGASFYSEIALLMAEKMQTESVTNGSILIYGTDISTAADNVRAAISEAGFSAYGVKSFARKAINDQSAAVELTSYLSTATDVCGIIALGSDDAAVAVAAASENVIVIANGFSESYEQLFANGLYAFCVEPIYDAAAMATLALCDMLDGKSVESENLLDRHFLTKDTVAKYASMRKDAADSFLLPSFSPTPVPTIAATAAPQTAPITTVSPEG